MNTKTKSTIFFLLVINFVIKNAFAFELGGGTHFGQGRGDRVIDGFKGASANTIQIQAGTYPTLIWVEGDARLSGILPQ
ncbi:hypothetical protein [Candidatus Methylobacter favarea]|uniref:hypothetical protein n=1 Tax=Candidatus Methylobacter favarea TaxID=2707345 RepID=UPI00157BE63D|nr:hypothetical protein [Candidatus Methylobacter favarea]